MARRRYVHHGSPRYVTKHYHLSACAAACSTIDLEGGSAEIHHIHTSASGCGTGANINFNIVTDYAGPQWLLFDSNNSCDTAAVDILVNGKAYSDSDQCITAGDERLIVVNIADVSTICTPLYAVIGPDDVDS